MKTLDLTNRKFGKLTAIKQVDNQKHKVMWECICDCGKTTFVLTGNLTSNRVKSCGCLKLEQLIKRSTTHNQRHTHLYEVWKTMKQRCFNKNHSAYHNYGSRGIIVCGEWKNSFENFYKWSTENGYSQGLTIDRIDNNGNYCPENCRWVNRQIQANNTRSNKYITINNETKSLSDWCRIYNVNYRMVYARICHNVDPLTALTTPSGCL